MTDQPKRKHLITALLCLLAGGISSTSGISEVTKQVRSLPSSSLPVNAFLVHRISGRRGDGSWLGGAVSLADDPCMYRSPLPKKQAFPARSSLHDSNENDPRTSANPEFVGEESFWQHPTLLSRRQGVSRIVLASFALTTGLALMEDADAAAAATTGSDDLDQAVEAIRKEVFSGPGVGGVAFMQQAIDEGNFPALLEFTKTYDQELRKSLMGKAKKLMVSPDKGDKERVTALCNAVTFDLIGINKSSRPGQQDAAQAQKYLNELKDDVQQFLDLVTAKAP